MRKFYSLFFFMCLSLLAFSQDLRVEKPVLTPDNNGEWEHDYTIIFGTPLSNMSGVQTSNGDIYIAINDTNSTANLGLIIAKSTSGGISWATITGVTNRTKYEKIKLVKSSQDSVYCFFQIGYSVYSWNINSSTINPVMVPGAYRSFDVEVTSTNSIYVVLDSLATNNLVRYASLDYGYNWGNRGSISSAAALPVLSKSVSGDTLFLNYIGPVLADTATSVIRGVRYRETSPGIVASATFQDVATGTFPKYEYKTVAGNGIAWFVYTKVDGSSQLWARQSTDGGLTYGAEFRVNPNETVNQYGFDLKAKLPAGNGFSFIYHADSAQVGPATSVTDKIQFGTALQSGSTFPSFTQINQVPAVYSSDNCKPIIVELPFYNSTGVAFLGNSVGSNRVFWNAFHLVPVELTSFSADVYANKVVLNWSTATETNNRGFSVEKKTTGNWEKIGFVNGNGTTTKTHSYSFIDNDNTAGKVYYRLNQIDLDGTSSFSKVVEVDLSTPNDYSLSQNFPNPFNPSTSIKFALKVDSKVNLKLYNPLGQEVMNILSDNYAAGNYNISVNASGLNSGVYFYTLEASGVDGSKFTSTKKMILMK
ncbi:MAG: T9SS type A sorting domain-containing protein [Bacteroidetes bacterium]|nr:T9SS type A sorting domain-containing protein [Bacteroidota bacterium]